jgi:hypothetical protein
MTPLKRNLSFICLLLLFQLFFASCARYVAVAQDGQSEIDITGQFTHDTTLNVYFWGIATYPQFNSNKCASGTFHQVEVKSNVWQSLAGFLTLGIWRPMTIVCTCAKTFDNN